MRFVTKDIDCEVDDRTPDDTDRHVSKAVMEWEADLECRSWGIKGIAMFPRTLSFVVTDTLWTDDDNSETETEYNIDLIKDGWEVKTEMPDDNKWGQYCPSSIIVSLKEKKVEVTF